MGKAWSERRIILLLLVGLALEICALLFHLDVLSFQRGGWVGAGAQPLAGHVIKLQNHLRRRGLNSLVWETTEESEIVFFHDSLLTLSQSTAQLELTSKTQIALSENTLVTIEPPSEHEHGEIRLKFTRGDLHARNPFEQLQITTDLLTFDVRQGSRVDLRRIGEQEFEFRVTEGGAKVQSANGGTVDLAAREMLRISGANTAKMEVAADLAWIESPPPRIYTHEAGHAVDLKWEGRAHLLVLQTLGAAEQRFDLSSGEQERTVILPRGQHRLYLLRGGQASTTVDVQVWKAPVVHLLSPLPRDRTPVSAPIRFVWMQLPQARGYQLEIDGERSQIRKEVEPNLHPFSFPVPENVRWSVRAIDEEGYEIPPLYKYDLFIREKLLGAPKLKVPVLRQPANTDDRGACLWRYMGEMIMADTSKMGHLVEMILPSAHADVSKTEPEAKEDAEQDAQLETVFSWEEVPGADHYIIEISETGDFRHPVVVQTTPRLEFRWYGGKARSYYWRVAAGRAGGRMGVFSEPARLDLGAINERFSGPQTIDGVRVTIKAGTSTRAGSRFQLQGRGDQDRDDQGQDQGGKAQDQARSRSQMSTATMLGSRAESRSELAARPPRAPPSAQIIPEALAPTALGKTRIPKMEPLAAGLIWRPKYSFIRTRLADRVRADVQGGQPVSLRIERSVALSSERTLLIGVEFAQHRYRPEPATEYPFQDDLKWNEWRLDLVDVRPKRRWQYGLGVHQGYGLERKDLESVRVIPKIWGSVFTRSSWVWWWWRYDAEMGARFTDGGYGVETRHELRKPIWYGSRWIVGAGISLQALFPRNGNHLIGESYFLTGYEF